MTQIVVDTDVLSFLFKNHPIGLRYDPELAGRVALISFMTVAELERWAIQYRWGAHRLDWLHLYLKRFTVVPSSPDLCRKRAEVMVAAQAAGRRIECADAWVAATARLYGVPLVTLIDRPVFRHSHNLLIQQRLLRPVETTGRLPHASTFTLPR